METVQVGDQTGELSLIQIWVEAITQELGRLYGSSFSTP